MTMRLAVIVLALGAAGAAQESKVPGWKLSGMAAREYEISVDREVFHGGHASALVRCTRLRCKTFGTLMQGIRADDFIGRRVRLSAWVRAENAQSPRLWMRIDGPAGEVVGFDNMDGRAKSGTFEWRRQEIVLDVTEPGMMIYFGLILERRGQAWVDDVTLEVVDRKAKTTRAQQGVSPSRGDPMVLRKAYLNAPAAPANPDFEQDAAR
jgi:hypothetical protein